MIPTPEHPFDRKIVENSNNLLIESTCALCGFRIVGSVTQTLCQDESSHAETCRKLRSKAASSAGSSD